MLMASYKVIQDIEAEDKLIWQLSFRQFVYALIAAVFLYFSYLFLTSRVIFMAIFTLPVALFCGFLAYPFGKDQPTEVWALSKLRFFFKPRRRIWAQSGVKELVTITVPKKVEVDLTKGLTQTEVKSRLQALADTIDSRGWAVKNIGGVYQSPLSVSSDRLIGSDALSYAPADDASDADDILDVGTNPVAQKMDQMLVSSASRQRQDLIDSLDQIREKKVIEREGLSPIKAPSPSGKASTEAAITKTLEAKGKSQNLALSNMRTINPTGQAPVKESTAITDPDIIRLAGKNDWNVTTIKHEIDRARGVDLGSSGNEVTISLR